MLSDLESVQAATLRPIAEVAAELGLDEGEIERLRERPDAE